VSLLLLGKMNGQTERKFPFTAKENEDGSRFVWFIYMQSGLPYDYAKSDSFPYVKNFAPSLNNIPQAFDVAWWKDFMAIYDSRASDESNLITAQQRYSLLATIKKHGPVKYFRYQKMKKVYKRKAT
jgi:hypothetical protein